MNDLTPANLAHLSKQLKTDIDSWCSHNWDEGPRSHLGASEIGHSCSKYLFLKFRWAFYKVHDGRQQRLFQRGHFEEPRFIQYLEGIGCKVTQFDEDAIARGETDKGKMQLRISACKGHFGGSLDAEIELPERYGIVGKMLSEFKTIGSGKQGSKVSNFDKLVKDGVKLYKPVHWGQQCIYGYKRNLDYSLYITVYKNTDDLHLELIALDHFLGASLEKKAEMIIFAEEAPAGISCSQSYYECSYCDAKEQCHMGQPALVNCRSCRLCHPVEGAAWYCEKWANVVPKEFIPNGCSEWISII